MGACLRRMIGEQLGLVGEDLEHLFERVKAEEVDMNNYDTESLSVILETLLLAHKLTNASVKTLQALIGQTISWRFPAELEENIAQKMMEVNTGMLGIKKIIEGLSSEYLESEERKDRFRDLTSRQGLRFTSNPMDQEGSLAASQHPNNDSKGSCSLGYENSPSNLIQNQVAGNLLVPVEHQHACYDLQVYCHSSSQQQTRSGYPVRSSDVCCCDQCAKKPEEERVELLDRHVVLKCIDKRCHYVQSLECTDLRTLPFENSQKIELLKSGKRSATQLKIFKSTYNLNFSPSTDQASTIRSQTAKMALRNFNHHQGNAIKCEIDHKLPENEFIDINSLSTPAQICDHVSGQERDPQMSPRSLTRRLILRPQFGMSKTGVRHDHRFPSEGAYPDRR